MFFMHNSTTSVDKPNFPLKLYTFTGIVEQKYAVFNKFACPRPLLIIIVINLND